MEKKNTILLTVIAVATLLVAVVGATFAYFTASTASGDPADATGTGTTTTVGGVNLLMETATSANDIAYPGGYVVTGASVTATNTDATNGYKTTYTVNGTITNNTKTQLNWYLYKVDASIAEPIVADSCERQEQAQGDGTTRYYYTGCQLESTIASTGSAIANGKVDAAADGTPGTATVTKTGETLTTTASGEADTYYYLVVEYPNNTEASQNADQGKTITAVLTNVSAGSSTINQ